MMRLKTVGPLLALAAVMMLAIAGSIPGLPPPVDPDEPSDCTGPSDPFCAPGGETTTCKVCQLKNGTFKCKLDSKGRGDTCTIVWGPTSFSCGITGSC